MFRSKRRSHTEVATSRSCVAHPVLKKRAQATPTLGSARATAETPDASHSKRCCFKAAKMIC